MEMNRRAFLGTMGAVGLSAIAGSVGYPWAAQEDSDRIIVNGLDTSVFNEGFIKLLQKGKVDCVHKSAGGPQSLSDLWAFVDTHSEVLAKATTVREIRKAKKDGKIAVLQGSQAANDIERLLEKTAMGTYTPLAPALRLRYELGQRFQGICYNATNIFGGGCLDHDVPLTRAGERLVEEIHKLRMILDVGGHTGEATSLEAIAISKGVPVVCTHTNVAALNKTPRASSNKVIEAIAGTGGVIGITAISDFLVRNTKTAKTDGPISPQADMGLMLDQFDYMKELVGIDHIGVGPDFVWGWGHLFNHNSEISLTFPPEALSNGAVQTVKGFEDTSKFPNLIRGFKDRGWTDAELDKVLGGNWLRVYEKIWGA